MVAMPVAGRSDVVMMVEAVESGGSGDADIETGVVDAGEMPVVARMSVVAVVVAVVRMPVVAVAVRQKSLPLWAVWRKVPSSPKEGKLNSKMGLAFEVELSPEQVLGFVQTGRSRCLCAQATCRLPVTRNRTNQAELRASLERNSGRLQVENLKILCF